MIIRGINFLMMAALATGCGNTGGKKSDDSKPGQPADQPAPGPTVPPNYDLLTDVKGLTAKDGVVHTGSLSLQFNLIGNDKDSALLKLEGFECRFNLAGNWAPCDGSPLPISNLQTGMVLDFSVRARVRDIKQNLVIFAKEADLHFRVDLTDNVPTPGQTGLPPDVNNVRAISSKLQIGNAYLVTVPVGEHVTEYSTSKTTGVLSFFRILPESDPYYLGNHSCVRDWDRVVASASPAGEPLMYCHSTPTREAYKAENEDRLANNHVEIATDTKLVANDMQERLSVSIFDDDYEFMAARSRFGNICQNSVKRYITVPMIPNFFIAKAPEQVDFWICDVSIPNMDGSAGAWRVGAFYDIDHMDWNCPDCKYNRAVEMVYMARVTLDNHLDANFAKTAQQRFLDVMTKLTP